MQQTSFVYAAQSARVLFGAGMSHSVVTECERLGVASPLIVCSSSGHAVARTLVARFPEGRAGVFSGAAMHTPVDVTDVAMGEAKRHGADGLIAVGGGSAIGLSKAIALRTDLPQIAIPTTYSGSEMTSIIGQTEHGRKATQADAKVRPETVIYDVDLTINLPALTSGTSAINALAHAVEALYAPDRNPLSDLIAKEAISALTSAIPRFLRDPGDPEARAEALYGAWLCGLSLSSVGMSLHHKLCHTLGGLLGLPHAETHTVMLPYALAYNAPAARGAMDALRTTLASDDPIAALRALALSTGAPRSLQALGMAERDIDRAVDEAMTNQYPNPRPLARDALRRTIADAWSGAAPQEDG